jgi:hypothetical protein
MIQHLLSRYSKNLQSFIVFSLLLLMASEAYAQTVTGNTTGNNNGYFYSFWNDGSKGSASMNLGTGGSYSTTWSNIGNFTAGKGWAVGSPNRVVCYSGTFNGGSNGFLALYGWTKNNLIEYYVCENHGSWTPPGNTSGIVNKGTFTSDGGTYTIYTATRTNAPSISGTATFQQYWSVRTQTRSSGTITFANHVAAWKAAGMNMGSTWDYQIMETEGYMSSGSSNITMSECTTTSPCTTAIPTVVPSVNYCQNATANVLTATGTSLLWYTTSTGGTGSSTAPKPSTGTVGTTNYFVSQTLGGCEGSRAQITVTINATPIAPVAAVAASYCQNATATALTATGTGLLWYTASAGGTGSSNAPKPSTAVVGTANYFVSQTTNGCESPRAQIAVTVNTAPTAPVVSTVSYCQNATASALTATGMGLLWYTSPTGGTGSSIAPIPLTSAVGTTNYYVSQSTNGCESPRTQIAVTVNALPTAPTAAAVSYCQNATAPALTATGTGLLWYSSATGGTGSSTAPIPTTTTVGTTNYYVSQKNGCESPRTQLPVMVNALPTATITAGSTTTFCPGGSVILTSSPGTLYIWKNGTTQVGTGSTYSATTSGAYTVEVMNASNCKATSVATTVVANSVTVAPIVSPVSYCQNATASALTATGTGLLWYTSATGGIGLSAAPLVSTNTIGVTNYFVSQSTSGCESARAQIAVTVTAAPTVPVATGVSYCQNATVTALTATGTGLLWYTGYTGGTGSSTAPIPSTSSVGTTNYYVSQTTNGCESPRAQIIVTINALPVATITAGSATTFCSGGSVMLASSGGSSFVWKNGTTQVGTGGTYLATTAGSYTVEVTNAGSCKATSAATAVMVNTAPTAPVVSTVSYCQNATASTLTATGTGILWYTSSTGGTGSSTALVPSTSAVGTTNYYVTQTTNGCESSRAQIVVIINALPTAVITAGGATTFCSGGSVILTSTGGSYFVWKNGITQVGTGDTYLATTAGSYTVDVTNLDGCIATSAATVVTVNATPTAPIVSTVSYCQNATATALTATGTGLLWYTTSTGGTGSSTAPIPTTTNVGTTNYYVSQTTGCESPRAQIAVTVNALPTATITPDGSTTIINGATVTLNANTGIGWTYEWFNGTTQIGATNSSYVASAAGNYTVQVTNAFGCMSISMITSISTTQNQPSIITITSFGNNAIVSKPLTITADVTNPDGAILVEYLDGNTVIGSSTSAPYSFIWINPSEGPHTITVRAKNASGGIITTSAPVNITVNPSTTTGIHSSMNNAYATIYPIPAINELIVESGMDLTISFL